MNSTLNIEFKCDIDQNVTLQSVNSPLSSQPFPSSEAMSCEEEDTDNNGIEMNNDISTPKSMPLTSSIYNLSIIFL